MAELRANSFKYLEVSYEFNGRCKGRDEKVSFECSPLRPAD